MLQNMVQRMKEQKEAGMAELLAIFGLQSELSSLLAFWFYLIYSRKSNSVIMFTYISVSVCVYSPRLAGCLRMAW